MCFSSIQVVMYFVTIQTSMQPVNQNQPDQPPFHYLEACCCRIVWPKVEGTNARGLRDLDLVSNAQPVLSFIKLHCNSSTVHTILLKPAE